jgi:hypothetical protein
VSYTWLPGALPDETAITRLKQHFPKPEQPPPEAWFISGEVSYWYPIADQEPADIDLPMLELYLSDSSSGIKAFPKTEFAIKSWLDWYHYLLPHLIYRAHEAYMLVDLINYFIQIYPDEIPDVYPEFRSDMLYTLGRAIMCPQFWGDKDLSKQVIEGDHQYWIKFGGNNFIMILSPALFFCIKYLNPSEIENWCQSLLNIEGIHWHYNLMLWIYERTFLLMTFEGDDVSEIVTHSAEQTQFTTIRLRSENVKMFIQVLRQNHVYYG